MSSILSSGSLFAPIETASLTGTEEDLQQTAVRCYECTCLSHDHGMIARSHTPEHHRCETFEEACLFFNASGFFAVFFLSSSEDKKSV